MRSSADVLYRGAAKDRILQIDAGHYGPSTSKTPRGDCADSLRPNRIDPVSPLPSIWRN
jgi:hypothetical protein